MIYGTVDLLPDDEREPDSDDVDAVVHGCYYDGAFFFVGVADFTAPASGV